MHTIVSLDPPYCLPFSPRPFEVSFILLSLLVPDKKLVPRRPREIPSSRCRRLRHAKDISATSIPPRVIAHGMNFTSRSHVKRRRSVAHDARGKRRTRTKMYYAGRGEKLGGSSNSLLQPRGTGRESRLWSKNVTCVRQSQAKGDAALRPPGNSKEIYGPPRVLAVARHDGKRRSRRHSTAARETHAIAKSIQLAIGRSYKGTSTCKTCILNTLSPLIFLYR